MGSDQRIEAEGRTLKEAIERACEVLNISMRELEYKLNGEHFRGGADTVKIVAWRRDNREAELSERARDYLNRVFELADIPATVDVETEDDSIRAIVVTEEADLLLGKGGVALDALQHLANRSLVRHKSDKRIVLDMENFREKREHNIRLVAQKLCEKVLQDRCTITLKPMNAYDRRLVHMEVSRYPELGSRSVGEGQLKRLQIFVEPEKGSA